MMHFKYYSFRNICHCAVMVEDLKGHYKFGMTSHHKLATRGLKTPCGLM